MTQAQAATGSTTNGTTNGNGNGNGSPNGSPNGNAGRQAKVLTAIDAITKITKILEPLSLTDRKRVLAFVNEEHSESTAGNA